jgi:hypothetical protein
MIFHAWYFQSQLGVPPMREIDLNATHHIWLGRRVLDHQGGDGGASLLTFQMADDLRPDNYCSRSSGKRFEGRRRQFSQRRALLFISRHGNGSGINDGSQHPYATDEL